MDRPAIATTAELKAALKARYGLSCATEKQLMGTAEHHYTVRVYLTGHGDTEAEACADILRQLEKPRQAGLPW